MPRSISMDIERPRIELPPLWAEDAHKDDEKFRVWFTKVLPGLEEEWKYYIQRCTTNLNWYLGIESQNRPPRIREADGQNKENKMYSLPVVFNHSYDLVEQRVNRLSRFKPNFDTLPAHEEPKDINNARLAKIILAQVARRNRLEMLLQRGDRVNAIMGMYYLGVEWNQAIGDYIDRKNKDKGREGDVGIYIQDPRNVLPWPTDSWEECPCIIDIYKVLHKDEAKKRYGIEPPKTHSRSYYTAEDISYGRYLLDNHVIIYRVIYKPDDILLNGFYRLCYQDGTLLPSTNQSSSRTVPTRSGAKKGDQFSEYPYSHEGFPYERLTDVDIIGTQIPFTTFENLIEPQKHHDRILGLKLRNLYLLSHPKILMPKNSCKLSSWANTPLFVEYNGGIPPKVVTFNTSAPEVDNSLLQIRAEMDQLYGIQPTSRGNPPPGTRSGVQLLFFEEQEQQRASIDIIKRNEFIRRVYTKIKDEVGDHYPTSSKARLVREVGKNNEVLLRAIETSKLSSDLEIEIQNATAFSESKAVKTQQVLEIMERQPDLLSKEQAADALDLGTTEKVFDIATAALRKAQWENQEIRFGNELTSPQPWEDLLIHLREHYIEIQSIGFARLEEEKKKRLFAHIEITEGLAEELIEKGNEQFESELKTLRQYPMFYVKSPELTATNLGGAGVMPASPTMPPGMMGQVGGAAGFPNEFMTPSGVGGEADMSLPPGPSNNGGFTQ